MGSIFGKKRAKYPEYGNYQFETQQREEPRRRRRVPPPRAAPVRTQKKRNSWPPTLSEFVDIRAKIVDYEVPLKTGEKCFTVKIGKKKYHHIPCHTIVRACGSST